jgi:DNA-binding MarR family transcriptional regulator
MASNRNDAPSGEVDPLWGTLIEAFLGMHGWWLALCDELRLTPAQGMALRSLEPGHPLAMSTLAEALACDASNITGIVDKLESRGLIARRGAEHDRRIKMLVVTERGRSLRERLIRRLLEPPAAICNLSAEVKGRLTAILRAVIVERLTPAPAAASDTAPARRRPARAARG